MTPVLRPYNSRAIADLVPYDANARTHAPEQVEQIAAAIREWGFTNPLLITPEGRVLAGHGRLLAAQSLGMAEVPCIELADLTPVQQRALIIADNKLALNAGWDLDLLRSEIKALELDGFDLDLMGFNPDELIDLFTVGSGGGDPDAAPALREVPTSGLGDVWVMGPHRVCCGDSTGQEAWDAVMDGARADIVWTDPPYNVNYEARGAKLQNDNLSGSDFLGFLAAVFAGCFNALKPGGIVYCAHADTEGLNFRAAFTGAGFKLSGCVIWKKDSLVLGRSDYQWIHEPILYGWKPGGRHRWFGGRKNTTVLDLGSGSPFQRMDDGRFQVTVGGEMFIVDGAAQVETLVPSLVEEPRPRSSTEHPTMKPVALIERQLMNSARHGDIVVDPCAGSGSTLIAADRLGMHARVIELDPLYADVIVRRWQDLTGRKAVNAATGLEFGD